MKPFAQCNPCPIFPYMLVESCGETVPSHRKKRTMSRAKRLQSEQYTILHSRLHKSIPLCRTCHSPVHRGTPICPWCGANRAKPVTGVTEQLPTLPAPAPWYRAYDRLLPAVLLTFFQARLWLWLWPMPEHAVGYRTATPQFMMFYYAMAFAFAAAVFYQCRWAFRLGVALIGLLFCWVIRALMA